MAPRPLATARRRPQKAYRGPEGAMEETIVDIYQFRKTVCRSLWLGLCLNLLSAAIIAWIKVSSHFVLDPRSSVGRSARRVPWQW